MKIVINTCYGGFSLPQDFCDTYGFEKYDAITRTDERLVDYVNERGGLVKDGSTRLRIVDIPDDCTDWEISEYDGAEHVIYVLDGIIHHSYN